MPPRVRRRHASHCGQCLPPSPPSTSKQQSRSALAEYRPELEQLVRERARLALAELTRELVAAELNGHSNGGAVPLQPSTKRCSACDEVLPLDHRFYADSRRGDGRRSIFKACSERARAETRHAQQEAEPVPFAGAQSPTSLESTPASARAAFSPTRYDAAGSPEPSRRVA